MSYGDGSAGGSIASSTDVNLSSPQNNEVLSYSSSSSKWENRAFATTGSVPSATKVVASSSAPANIKAAADYVCDGSSDEVEINLAIAAIASDTISLGTQGGTVLLWGTNFSVAGPILMRSQVTLEGVGQWATVVKPVGSYRPGSTGGVIQLYSPNSQYTTVRNLAIHGNASAGALCCGIYYAQGVGQEYDASHRMMDMYIYATGWHGISLVATGVGNERNRGMYLSNIRIIDAGTTVSPTACGLNIESPDSFFIGVDVGSSASHGIRVAGSNNRFVSCKAWYSGSLATAVHQGCGFYMSTGGRNEFSGCEAQDNYGDGFYVGGGFQTLSSCMADSNGYNRGGGAGAGVGWTGSGFYVSGWTTIQGIALDKNEAGRGIYQKYAVESAYGNIKVIINVVTGVSGVGNQGGSAFSAGSVVNII